MQKIIKRFDIFQNPGYMKENFKLVIETLHVPDKGNQDNVSFFTGFNTHKIIGW
jgi:hypothetical protein